MYKQRSKPTEIKSPPKKKKNSYSHFKAKSFNKETKKLIIQNREETSNELTYGFIQSKSNLDSLYKKSKTNG